MGLRLGLEKPGPAPKLSPVNSIQVFAAVVSVALGMMV